MRVLFLIPKNNPPQLTGNYSKTFKEFIETCLNKDPENRPTAKELLRHPFVKKAKRNNHLSDLIDRYRKWKLTHTNESDSDSEASENPDNDGSDSDWDIGTIKEPVSPYIEQFDESGVGAGAALRKSDPMGFTNGGSSVGVVVSSDNHAPRARSPVKQAVDRRSPPKDVPVPTSSPSRRSGSPLKDNRPAKSELNLARPVSEARPSKSMENLDSVAASSEDLRRNHHRPREARDHHGHHHNVHQNNSRGEERRSKAEGREKKEKRKSTSSIPSNSEEPLNRSSSGIHSSSSSTPYWSGAVFNNTVDPILAEVNFCVKEISRML